MQNFLKLGRAAAFALIVQSTLSSLSGATLILTTEQAVAHALAHNPSLAAARTAIDQAQGRYRQAGRWQNPELSLDYASDRWSNDAGERAFAVGFEQRFPVTNRLRMQKNIARDEVELAQAEVANQARLLALQVESSVAGVAEIQAQLKLREEMWALNTEFAVFIESRIETGEASSIDANQIKIETYAVQQAMQQLRNKLIERLAALRQLIGLDVDTAIETAFEFALPQTQPDLPILTHEALQNHPEYRMKSLLYVIADKQVAVERATCWADIALRVFFEEERSVDDPGGLGTDRSFGVGVSIPLPLMNRNNGAIEASIAQLQRIRYELDSVSAKIRSDARSQRERVLHLYAQTRDYETNLTQLVEKNLRDMTAAYGAGQVSLTELFRSQEQGLKIQSTHLAMLHDFEQAMINWKAATAQPGEQAQ